MPLSTRVLLGLILALFSVLVWASLARSASTVGINKAFTPANVNFGTDSTLTITLLNNDPTTTVTVTSVTDNLPAGLSVDLTVTPTTTCAGGTVTDTATSVTLTGGIIPKAPDNFNPGTCTITLSVYGADTQNYVNTIPVGALVTSGGSNTTAASATLQVTNPGNIGVAIAVSPNQVPETASPVFVVTVSNPNNLPLTNVTIPGNLTSPVGGATLHIVGVATTCGGSAVFNNAVSPPTFTVTGATIPANGSCTVSVTVSVNGQVINVVRSQRLTVAAETITSTQGVTNSTAATADVTYYPITPVMAKSWVPSTTVPGATVVLTLSVTNRDTIDLTNFGFTDVLPGGLTLGAPPNLANTCGGPAGTISGTTTVLVTGLTITKAPSLGVAAPTCKITFNVLVPAAPPSQAPNNIVLASSVTNDQVLKPLNNPAAVLTVGPTPAPVVTFSKAFSPNSVARGNNSTLTINIVNPAGSLVLSSVNISDTLPAGLVIASTPTVNANCGAPTIVGVVGTTSISMTGGTVGIAKTCTLSTVVTATTTGPFPIVLHNIIPPGGITGTKSDSTVVSNAADVTGNITVTHGLTNVHYFSPFAVTVAAGPIKTALKVQDQIVSTAATDDHNLTATFNLNVGAANAVKLAASNVFTYVCTKGSVLAFTPAGNSLSYTVTTADFIFKDSCTISYFVTSTIAGTYTAGTSTVASTEDNTQTIAGVKNVQFVAPSEINVNKTFTPNSIPAAGVSHLQITLSNDAVATGSGIVFNETGVALTDTLPAGMIINSPPNASTTCANATLVAPAGGSQIQMTGASLPSRTVGGVLQPCTITVDVTSTSSGNVTNTIPAGSITADSGATNAFAASATLSSSANISLVKTFIASVIPPGGSTWVALTFKNASNASITVTSVTDNMPSAIVVKDITTQPPPQGGAPPNCAATVVGSAGSSSFSLTSFTIAANASCVSYVYVTTATPTQFGTFTNTIPASAIVTPSGLTNFLPTSANITVAAVTLSLTKLVRNVTTGGSDATTGNASPGDTLLYTLTYTNTSPFPEANLVVHDTLPPNTTFVSATCGTLGAGLTACTPSGPTAGVVTWTLTGSLNSGASGTVILTVTVN